MRGSGSMKNVYIGNLPYDITDDGLSQLFSEYGEVSAVKVVKDARSGKSKGFAFVEMGSGAEKAIEALDGKELQGRTLRVAEAHGGGAESKRGFLAGDSGNRTGGFRAGRGDPNR